MVQDVILASQDATISGCRSCLFFGSAVRGAPNETGVPDGGRDKLVKSALLKAMAKTSAGLLMFRHRPEGPELLLVHPGGPFWAKKDLGAWSIPKGEYTEEEDPLDAAKREFEEETGFRAAGPFAALTPIKQGSGKIVSVWAFEGDCNPGDMKSNLFQIEWPPGSGRQREFPEADRAAWFSAPEARRKISSGQAGFIDELERILAAPHVPARHL